MLKKVWKLKEKVDAQLVKSLADTLNITETLAELLIRRDVDTYFSAKTFFNPSLESLHDPFLMDGMRQASFRIIQAVANNEKIYIHGDYDVDGTCAAALMYLFLKELKADVEIYIPNRLVDGYGITKSGIDFIKEKGANLIISVDCGITAVDEIEYAQSLGMDVIVSDHHQPGDRLPPAHTVLDPLKPQCNYPFKFLSGAGVAFKLAQAISDRIGKKELPFKYLDLVALAGAADIVSLTDENRVLVKFGLDQINATPRPGILEIIKKAGLEPGNLTAGQVVFTIAPRINAVGRMGEAMPAIDLFLSLNEEEAEKYAEILELENQQRRKIDELTFTNACELTDKMIDLEKEFAIVLHNDQWHPGVIGIVASRLVEKYYRPTILLTTMDSTAKGSARSINGFNIYEALKRCEGLIQQFGGHEAAAGLALDINNIDAFRKKFNEVVRENLKESDIAPELMIDEKIEFSELSPKFLRILEKFSPYGPGNMRPVFLAENVDIHFTPYSPKIVGGAHLMLTLKQKGCDKVFDAIGFNLGVYESEIKKDATRLDIVFTIENTTRNGKTYPQIRIKDLRIKQIDENNIENNEIAYNLGAN